MNAPGGPQLPRKTLFAHALEIHQREPDKPLPRDGYPFPDDAEHRGRKKPPAPQDQRQAGIYVAAILERHFAEASPDPAALAAAVHRVHVPIYRSDHIAAAALNPERDRVLETGRWLILNGTDRCAVTVGLALLEAVGITSDDVPLVQTIGLLSDRFGELASLALEKIADKPASVLLWLADRVTGWGRVSAMRSLCRFDDPAVQHWLLRKAIDGDFLNGYFAGQVARAGRLHEAVDDFDSDPELVDSAGRILWIMTECEGMGLTLENYEHANTVLRAHYQAISRLGPTLQRYYIAALIARHLSRRVPPELDQVPDWESNQAAYRMLLDHHHWHQVALAGLAEGDGRMRWLADIVAPELGLVLDVEE